VTEALDALVPLAVALPLLVALATLLGRPAMWIDRVGRVGGVAAAVPALVIATVALARADEPALTGLWWRVDGRGAVFLATTAVVGAIACAVSPAYLRGTPTSRAGSLASRRLYWSVMLAFWAILLAVPLADDLGLAWILLEASTATSALLIAFTGKASAVEAGWKYLVLTSLGLAFTLFGIVILSVQMAGEAGGPSIWAGTASRRRRPACRAPRSRPPSS
jgi:hydrogenase-4 component F